MNPCKRLAHEAMKTEAGSSAWQLWQVHGKACTTCEKEIKVWQELQRLGDQPIAVEERLGDERTQLLMAALAEQKQPRPGGLNLRFLAVAGIAAIVVIALLIIPEKEPFNMVDSSSRWAQIAANPDWDLETEHPLRARIQTLRDDFRTEKTSETPPTENKQLKDRLQRFRENLKTEF